MQILKKDIIIDSLDVIITISYVKDHEQSYAVERTVQIFEGNSYVDYDEDALETIVNFIGIDVLDRYVKEQLGEAA